MPSDEPAMVDSEPTPTPPPMVVASDQPVDHVTAPLPAESPRRAWGWLPLLTVLCIISAVGLRYAKTHGKLPWDMMATNVTTQATPAAAPAPTASATPAPSASSEWDVTHGGHIAISGGVMFLPKTFVPAPDGTYNLILHFHGNANIVRESVEHAGLNAVLAVVNWGIRSGPYREAFHAPGAFEALLAQIDAGVKRRGVATPKLSRLALTSWSAGYGAIESILEHRRSPSSDKDPLEALIAIDGIHAAFMDGDRKRLKERTIRAWVHAAKAAAAGGVMLSMTHSEIDPIEFASARRTQLHILEQLDEEPVSPPVLRRPEHLALEAAKIAVAPTKEKRMVPIMDARLGNLRIQGFEGITKEHHIAHLTQMAAVALPDLARLWKGPRQRDAHGEREGDKKPSSSSEQ